MYDFGSALMFFALGLGLLPPLLSWIATGSVDRYMRPALYRLWCVCLVLFLLGIYLIS